MGTFVIVAFNCFLLKQRCDSGTARLLPKKESRHLGQEEEGWSNVGQDTSGGDNLLSDIVYNAAAVEADKSLANSPQRRLMWVPAR